MGKRCAPHPGLLVLAVVMGGLSANLALAGGALVFGYNPDSSPVSSSEIIRNSKTGDILGYCGKLAEFLRGNGYTLEPSELHFEERFVPFAVKLKGKPGIQCGPDSITRQRMEVLDTLGNGSIAEFSTPFALTSTKLLIRQDKLEMLYTQPGKLRIGLLEDPTQPIAITTSLIKSVYPMAHAIRQANRAEAIKHLLLPADQPMAIDAYASDEIILADMLMHDIHTIAPARQVDFVIAPTLYGYSREEYAVVVYNSPELLKEVNGWVVSDKGKEAAASLVVPEDSFIRTLRWVLRDDHLPLVRLFGSVLSALLVLLIILRVWLRWRRQARKSALSFASLPEQIPEEPVTEDETTPNQSVAAFPHVDEDGTASSEADNLLTTRQLEVARLWANGDPAGVIARKLDIPSQRTVEAHIRAIYQRTGTNNKVALFKYLQEHNLL